MSDWWTEADVKAFETATKALIAQYDAYEPLPGEHVKGEFTLGENIGDLAGLTIAYDAWKHSLGGKPAPVIDGMTGDQRFFLGWAQVWRRNYRDANLRQRLLTDPHSPSAERAAVVRNLDAWYAAFAPKAGQKLYLAPDARVRIWVTVNKGGPAASPGPFFLTARPLLSYCPRATKRFSSSEKRARLRFPQSAPEGSWRLF